MTPPTPDEFNATHDSTVLDVLARTELSELCRRIAAELNLALDHAAVAILLVDASGKQLLVAAAVGLPERFDDVVLATSAPGGVGQEVSAAVEKKTPWLLAQQNEPAQLPGTNLPIAAVVPILLPGGSRAHGAVVVLGEQTPDIARTTTAAQLIALHIEAELDRTYPLGSSTRRDSGLPDETHLMARIERSRAEQTTQRLDVVFSVQVRAGPYHAPHGEQLAKDDIARVAAILQQCVRPHDLVAHLGEADFAIVATDLGSDKEVTNFGIRIVEAVSGTAAGSDHPVGVYEANVGGAVIDDLGDNKSLLGKAIAAREESLDRFGLTRDPSQSQPRTSAPTTPNAKFDAHVLLTALREGQIQPWYQPVFELAGVRTVAVEALARWIRPDGEVVSPADFLPAVQHHHLMSRLTSTILRAVIRDQAVWHAEGLVRPNFTASVNISMSDVTGGMLPAVVGSLIDEYQLEPSYINLELTETEAMADVNYSLAMLHQLRDIGVGLAIDDFGTGYSSLSYLSQLPVDIVKIDRVFVAGLNRRRGDEAIVGAVVDVAKAVGLKVLAEGIETEEQLHQLIDLGVELGQGFLVAPALRPDALLAHLEAQSARL